MFGCFCKICMHWRIVHFIHGFFFLRAVCRRFLQQHEEYRDRLYEVEAPGSWTQRQNIWLNIQLGRYTLCKNVWLKRTKPSISLQYSDNWVFFSVVSLGINEENSRASGDRKTNNGNCSFQKVRTWFFSGKTESLSPIIHNTGSIYLQSTVTKL